MAENDRRAIDYVASIAQQQQNVPMIATFCGVPLNDMPRDELEREFAKACEKIALLQREVCDHSVSHIRDLAAMRRR